MPNIGDLLSAEALQRLQQRIAELAEAQDSETVEADSEKP